MSFKALAQSADELRTTLFASTGKSLVAEVSLKPPGGDRDEAAFIRSILWAYVLWFEACQPAGRYLMNIVRNSSPEDQKAASRAFQNLQNLRTFHAHNLLPLNKSDQYTLNQAKTWLVQNGGADRDWDRCTIKLCSDLTAALDIIRNHWNVIATSPEDAVMAIKSLTEAIERDWEPHIFDRIIEEVTTSLGLSDFDYVKYRRTRLNDWRTITEFFLDRTSAEAAVRRAIQQEMTLKFGAALL